MQDLAALKWIRLTLILSVFAPSAAHAAEDKFSFEQIGSLDEMHRWAEETIPLGTERKAVRHAFVEEGKAKLHAHPSRRNVEKYVYDINLCSYYVWRWNISANFTEAGNLAQIYVNGDPVHPAGTPRTSFKDAPKGAQAILKAIRLRPEAHKGEFELAYIVADGNTNSESVDDLWVMGAGPTRPDPADLGTIHGYADVEWWRSIFDADLATRVVPYSGDCSDAG